MRNVTIASAGNLTFTKSDSRTLITITADGTVSFDWGAIRAYLERGDTDDPVTLFTARAVHAAFNEGKTAVGDAILENMRP